MNDDNTEILAPNEDEFVQTLAQEVQRNFDEVFLIMNDFQDAFLGLERAYSAEEDRREKLDRTEEKVALSEKHIRVLMEITGASNEESGDPKAAKSGVADGPIVERWKENKQEGKPDPRLTIESPDSEF